METTYYALGTKGSFNKALRHFYSVTDVVDEVENGSNIASTLQEILSDEGINKDQILPIIGAVIKDKFNYSYRSFHIQNTISEFERIYNEVFKWTALDIVMVYFNPGGDIFVIDPKDPAHWGRVRELVRDQLAVLYVKDISNESKDVENDALNAMIEMLSGKDVFINKKFIDKTITPKTSEPPKAEPKAVEASGSRRVTPKYAVQVSNELFHNGNVEAWKKIVESYKASYPDLEVHIYFKDEVINDINSLFKWGKVKHGDSIFFQISGDDIRGVSKLQKYLYEGASPRFEQFLKIGVGRILKLF